MGEIEAKVRNVIDHALHQGQGESKPTVDGVMRWFEREGVGFRGISWSVDPCEAEVWSWTIFRSEQVDPYWIRCTRVGPHDEHEDSNTGATWTE